MKGEIEKIWDNESRNGERYLGLSVDGQRYTLWEEKYFDKLKDYERLSAEFDRITRARAIYLQKTIQAQSMMIKAQIPI